LALAAEAESGISRIFIANRLLPMFSQQLSLPDLAAFCRVLRHNLGAGLPLVRVLEQQAHRGPRGVRPLAGRLAEALRQGDSLSAAVGRERDVLPALFIDMATLGDETGHLPEIFAELEQYFQLQHQLRRQFRAQTILPVIQFFFAVLLFAGLLWLLGILAPPGRPPMLSFFGLSGAAGAVAFLGTVAGALALAWFFYAVPLRWLRQNAGIDGVLLGVPVVGPCLQALALSRLALALHLTLDSGLSIGRALRLSLNACGNATYAAAADGVVRLLKSGETLYDALARSGPFPEEFMQLIASAEESGRVPEVMRQQAAHYQEEAGRRLKLLAQFAAMGVWLVYAGFMVWAIFSIAGVYFRQLGI
jgi:type II secretory pathway component PulF